MAGGQQESSLVTNFRILIFGTCLCWNIIFMQIKFCQEFENILREIGKEQVFSFYIGTLYLYEKNLQNSYTFRMLDDSSS